MMFGEVLLYQFAKRFYRTEIAHTREMKASLENIDAYDSYRAAESSRMLDALDARGVDIRGKAVLDFGCADGAMSAQYLKRAASVVGCDIDAGALGRARELHAGEPRLTFVENSGERIPIDSESIDVAVAFDVLEHVEHPEPILRELRRVLRCDGRALIGTIGWRMPFAPHLWSVMPVPWAHVVFSERTLLRTCRRVYNSPWYRPNMHDFDAHGRRLEQKYTHEVIPTNYLNKYLVRDFEKAFADTGFRYRTEVVPFSSRYARILSRLPGGREFAGGSVWFTLEPQ